MLLFFTKSIVVYDLKSRFYYPNLIHEVIDGVFS